MLRTTWEEVQRALADPEGRIVVETSRRAALRTVANALGLGTMHESHFVVSRDWANRLDRHLAAAADEDRALTVADLRALIDGIDGPRGLPPEVADLVVLTVTAQCDHSLTHGGIAAQVTAGRAIDAGVTLRPEQLPSQDRWDQARHHAHAVFGENPGATVTGPEVGALADVLGAKAASYLAAAEQLVSELEAAYRRTGLDDGDRFRTAQAAAELARSLRGADGLATVEALASLDPPTSATALGTSLTTAGEVADALEHTNWSLLDAAMDQVGPRVHDLLRADELVAEYRAGRRTAEQEATDWLRDRRPAEPAPAPAEPGPVAPGPPATPAPAPATAFGNGQGTIDITSPADLDDALAQLRAALEQHRSIRITWHAPGTP